MIAGEPRGPSSSPERRGEARSAERYKYDAPTTTAWGGGPPHRSPTTGRPPTQSRPPNHQQALRLPRSGEEVRWRRTNKFSGVGGLLRLVQPLHYRDR
jgi:hypothetical protein